MKEEDIRPKQIFEEYLDLAAQDAINFFPLSQREDIKCPACSADASTWRFEKNGFQYQRCPNCLTLLSPLDPLRNVLKNFTLSLPAQY